MTDEQLEQAFEKAQERWVEANPKVAFNPTQQRYFFWAGSEFGLSATKDIYNETHEAKIA